jgi:hypothetical protein
MRVRPLLSVLAVAVTFAAGFASSRLLERNAQAQGSPLSSTVYIPSDGLVFRTFDGRVAAKLLYGPHGGVFEVFDEREQPSGIVRGGSSMTGRVGPKPVEVTGSVDAKDLGF